MIKRYVILGTLFNLIVFSWGFYTLAYAGVLMFMNMYDTFLGDVSEWIWLGISVANLALIVLALFVVYYHLRYVTRSHIPGRERMKSVLQVLAASAVVIAVFLMWWYSPMSKERAIRKAQSNLGQFAESYEYHSSKWDQNNRAWDVYFKRSNSKTCKVISVARTYTITTTRDCEYMIEGAFQ